MAASVFKVLALSNPAVLAAMEEVLVRLEELDDPLTSSPTEARLSVSSGHPMLFTLEVTHTATGIAGLLQQLNFSPISTGTLPTSQVQPYFSSLSQIPTTPLKVPHASRVPSRTMSVYLLSLAGSPEALNQRPVQRNHEYILFSKLFIVWTCKQICVP